MAFVFSLWDMGLWLAASSIIMLVTAELLSPYFGRINMNIDIKRLKRAAIVCGMAFLAIAATRFVYLVK
jgi:Ca2+/Na+ antiporter